MYSGVDAARVRVLSVEANPADADLVARHLGDSLTARFDLRHVPTFAQGLERAADADIVLLGMPMLDIESLPKIGQMRSEASGAAIIVLLGHGDESQMLEALRLGAQDVIPKSEIEPQALRRRIRFAMVRKQEEKLLRMLKTEADALNRSRAAFLASVSHEIRTPLNAIMGFSEIIRDQRLGPVGTAAYGGYAGDIHQAGSYLLGVINDLLDLSKVDAGQMTLRETEVDLLGVVGAACLLLQGRATAGRVRVSVDLPEGLPRLRGDRDRLQQVAVNLMSNAVKFTPPGGRVTISGRRTASGELEFSVADTGVGIPADRLARIWQPFGQAEDIYMRNREGVGLGLPLTAHLVRLHGGRIEVSSTPGKGTVFTATFQRDSLVAGDAPSAVAVPELPGLKTGTW